MTSIDTDQLKKQAVEAAIKQDWDKAVEYNQNILHHLPHDVASLNRLGFALMRQGQINEAKTTYQQVLSIDKYNPIANKTMQLLQSIKKADQVKSKPAATGKIITAFIEQPGKTKTVTLVRPGTAEALLTIAAGMQVKMVVKKRRVSIETFAGEYLGCCPDDIGSRLFLLLKEGFSYDTFIRSCQNKHLSVFITETERPKAKLNIISFPSTNSNSTEEFGGYMAKPVRDDEPELIMDDMSELEE